MKLLLIDLWWEDEKAPDYINTHINNNYIMRLVLLWATLYSYLKLWENFKKIMLRHDLVLEALTVLFVPLL